MKANKLSLISDESVQIEAVKWTGDNYHSDIVPFFDTRDIVIVSGDILTVQTLDGIITARRGDWIVRDINGKLSSCKPAVFEASYEPI